MVNGNSLLDQFFFFFFILLHSIDVPNTADFFRYSWVGGQSVMLMLLQTCIILSC